VNRPLLVIFLTILVNLIGFGIIIPLLPFYAETFGASPLTIGLLFASFSLAQLFASPVLGAWSDKWGRRPILIFSLVGTVVSFVMLAVAHSLAMLFAARMSTGCGGNITTARIGDITTEENRAKSFRMLGAAFGQDSSSGLRSAACSRGSVTPRRSGPPRDPVIATLVAWFWLPNRPSRERRVGVALARCAN
jgi:MFS family permease